MGGELKKVMTNGTSRTRRALRAGAIVCLLGLVVIATGCQRFPSERVPKMKWLVLPFEQPPGMATTPRAIRGWWFGARTIRQNPRAGEMFSETMARSMSQLDYINLFSNIDLKYYFADKRQLLKDAYPYLDDAEIQSLIDQLPDIEFGRELGADKILSGRIIRQYLGENRTIHWWWSKAEIEAQVTDVATGNVEWSKRYKVGKQLASQSSMQEKIAEKIIDDLQDDYFKKMVK